MKNGSLKDSRVYLPSSQLIIDLSDYTAINIRGNKKKVVREEEGEMERVERFRP